MALSYMAFTLWLVTLSYLAFPRILFAWGMDRMGPKWFTDINPRFASPVKNHILCLVLGEALITLYAFGPGDKMANIAITGMQIASVFAITALAAIVFPYVRRAKGIWDSSPYKKWTFIGLPVSVWGGVDQHDLPRHPDVRPDRPRRHGGVGGLHGLRDGRCRGSSASPGTSSGSRRASRSAST